MMKLAKALVTTTCFLAAVCLAGCGTPVQYNYEDLGTARISDHHEPIGGAGRRLCGFRVVIGGLTLDYNGSSTNLPVHNKCLGMKDGDQIFVRKRTRTAGNDNQIAVQYTGKVNEVEFTLQ